MWRFRYGSPPSYTNGEYESGICRDCINLNKGAVTRRVGRMVAIDCRVLTLGTKRYGL